MSADNGFILRRTPDNKYVLQQYSASSETLPSIKHGVLVFGDLKGAIDTYEEMQNQMIIEYGLTVKIKEPTLE